MPPAIVDFPRTSAQIQAVDRVLLNAHALDPGL
jgi:hypothetical protein